MTTKTTITAADITASIGRTILRVRLVDGTWVEAVRVSGFLEPLRANVVRALVEAEKNEAEAQIA